MERLERGNVMAMRCWSREGNILVKNEAALSTDLFLSRGILSLLGRSSLVNIVMLTCKWWDILDTFNVISPNPEIEAVEIVKSGIFNVCYRLWVTIPVTFTCGFPRSTRCKEWGPPDSWTVFSLKYSGVGCKDLWTWWMQNGVLNSKLWLEEYTEGLSVHVPGFVMGSGKHRRNWEHHRMLKVRIKPVRFSSVQ